MTQSQAELDQGREEWQGFYDKVERRQLSRRKVLRGSTVLGLMATGGLGAFLTAIYVMRAVKIIFWGEGPPEKFANLQDAEGTELVALWMLGVALIVFGVWPRLLLDLIDPVTPIYLQMVVP